MAEKPYRITTNPDGEFRRNFKQRLKANSGFCPCSLVKNPDTKCQCKAFRDMVSNKETGWCECGMYHVEQGGEDS